MTFGGSLEPLEMSDAGVLPSAVGRLDEKPRNGGRHGCVDLVENFCLDLGECIARPILNASFARDQNAAVIQPATRERDEIVRVRRLLGLQPEDAGKLFCRIGMKIVEAEVCLRPKLMFVLRRTTLVQSAQARDGDRWRAEGFRHVSQEVARENREALQRSTAGAQEQQLQRGRHPAIGSKPSPYRLNVFVRQLKELLQVEVAQATGGTLATNESLCEGRHDRSVEEVVAALYAERDCCLCDPRSDRLVPAGTRAETGIWPNRINLHGKHDHPSERLAFRSTLS